MNPSQFYRDMAPEQSLAVQQLARLAYDLREQRKGLLASYGCTDEGELGRQIDDGAVAAHPAYEAWLACQLLTAQAEAARGELAQQLQPSASDAAMPLHQQLLQQLQQYYGERIAIDLRPDALLLAFTSGLELEVRYLNTDHYSLQWRHEGLHWSIDTAPESFSDIDAASHWHTPSGVQPDPVTQPGRDPWLNLVALLSWLPMAE